MRELFAAWTLALALIASLAFDLPRADQGDSQPTGYVDVSRPRLRLGEPADLGPLASREPAFLDAAEDLPPPEPSPLRARRQLPPLVCGV
jgi:hypothetical protein